MLRFAASATLAAASVLCLLPGSAAAQSTAVPVPDALCELNLQLATLGLAHPPANSFGAACAAMYHPRAFAEPPFVTLSDGTALIAGGIDNSHPTVQVPQEYLSEAELYVPSTGLFIPTGNMAKVRTEHTVTLMHTGNVLVVGGRVGNNSPDPSRTAEVYYPTLHAFLPAAAPAQPHAAGHSATLLNNGKVLVAGGTTCGGYCMAGAAAELYDPAANKWAPAGSMTTPRAWHTATLLADGRVLVAGGTSDGYYSETPLASAEIYDPATNRFTPTGTLTTARVRAAAALLRDGRVLVFGSDTTCCDPNTLDIYDPAAGSFLPYGADQNLQMFPRSFAAVPLQSGKVLLVGTRPPRLFDPATNGFTPAGPATPACTMGPAALLRNGQVLMQGNLGAGCTLLGKTAVVYRP